MKKIIFLITLFLLIPCFAFGWILEVTWNANTDSDLAGYKIYYGTSSGVYSTTIDVKNVTIYDITNIPDNRTYYIALTAYDTSGNESIKSNEVNIAVPDITDPNLPIVITIKIQ